MTPPTSLCHNNATPPTYTRHLNTPERTSRRRHSKARRLFAFLRAPRKEDPIKRPRPKDAPIDLSPYRDDPLGFVKDILSGSGTPYAKQEELLNALVSDKRRVSVVGCNSSGKDWAAARAILWWIETRPKAKVIVTGPTLRQVKEIVCEELRAAHAAAKHRLAGSVRVGEYRAGPDRVGLCVTSNSQHNLQGFHSPELMVIVTEAQGIKQPYFEALKRLNPKKMLLLGNPLSLTGEFYDSHHGKSPLYERVSISAFDSPNVQEDRLDALPGLVTPEDVEERRREWGPDSPLYIASVLGQFPAALEDSLTSRVHVDAAIQRWRRESGDTHDGQSIGADIRHSRAPLRHSRESGNPEWPIGHTPRPSAGGERERSDARGSAAPLIPPSDGPHLNMPWRMGVDVARFGNDKSVICLRRGDRVERIISFERKDTMRLADEVREIAETLRVPAVFVDETGVGGGVGDRLKQLRVPVIGVEAGGSAYRPAQFADMRAEVFWEVARRLREGQMSLPPDDELAGQLLAQRYDISSAGRIHLESKATLRRQGVPSPDRADALALAFMEPPNMNVWF